MTMDTSAPKAGFAQGLALVMPVTLAVMGILLLVPVAPQMSQAFAHLPGVDFLVPVLMTLPALGIALFSPIAGILGDLYGRRTLLIRAMLVYAVAGASPFYIDDPYIILATRAVVGLCEAMILTLSTTLIGDLFAGKARDRWLSLQTAISSLSAILFLALGGALGRYGWQTPFLVYALSLPMALAVFLLVREPAFPAATSTAKLGWQGFPRRHMALSCGITALASILFYTIQINVSSVLPGFGITDPVRIGMLTAIASIGVPVGTLLFWAISRFPVRFLLAGEFTLIALALISIGQVGDATGFIAVAFVGQAAAGLLLPTLLTWAMSALRFEFRGRGMGMWQSTFSIGQFLSALVVPAIALHAGTIQGAFGYVGIGALVVGLILAMVGVRK